MSATHAPILELWPPTSAASGVKPGATTPRSTLGYPGEAL
jgi:hypothetical protein